jgi:phage shock protein PspC (stress-responsive transcriptional regulator)
MKEIIKASVAGYSFTFEKEAHSYLESYLTDIENHFRQKEDGKEIISDIEERISELLRMDMGEVDRVVTLTDVTHLVGIMGKPADMDDEMSPGNTENASAEEMPKADSSSVRKRIFRDEDSAMLGGVLSGLANYFQIDKVWLRLGFVLAVIVGHKFVSGISSGLILAYVVMWIVVPKAKTIRQKLAMSGKDPSISDIEAGNKQPLIKEGSSFGRAFPAIIRYTIAILLLLTGAGIIASYVFSVYFPSVINLPSFTELLEISGFYSADILWVLSLVALIPVAAIIYLAVRLICGFKRQDVVILGFTFLIWIGLSSYLGVLGVRYASYYKQEATEIKQMAVNTHSDTLYVRLADEYKYATDLGWVKDKNADCELKQINFDTKAWFITPRIEVVEDSTAKGIEIKVRKKAFAQNMMLAKEKAQKAVFDIIQRDSLILLKPHIYDKSYHWDREVFDFTVTHPVGKVVVLDDILNRFGDWDRYAD